VFNSHQKQKKMKNKLNFGAMLLAVIITFSSASCQKGAILDSITLPQLDSRSWANSQIQTVNVLILQNPVSGSHTGQVTTTGSNSGARLYKINPVQGAANILGNRATFTVTHGFSDEEAYNFFMSKWYPYQQTVTVERVGGFFNPGFGWQGGELLWHIRR
jgi:hypothetical protein